MQSAPIPVRRGAVLGLASYLLGYWLTYVVTVDRVVPAMAVSLPGREGTVAAIGLFLRTTPPRWVVAGWFYCNAHLVPVAPPGGPIGYHPIEVVAGNLLVAVTRGISPLFALPPALLVLAGYLVVADVGVRRGRRARYSAWDHRSGSVGRDADEDRVIDVGLAVAVGYYPAFLVGATAFAAPPLQGPSAAAPVVLLTVVFGLLYPVVFGSVGGVIANVLWRLASED